MSKPSRVIGAGDFHCGQNAGLTPPDFWVRVPSVKSVAGDKESQLRRSQISKQRKLQEQMWIQFNEWATRLRRSWSHQLILALNGDLIDGRGERSGGSEIIVPTVLHQCDMAVQCAKVFKADRVVMSYGTPYHTGDMVDHEDNIAARLNADKIGAHVWFDVNGLVFDLKHQPAGGSTIPHGRHTGVAKDRLSNIMWWIDEERQPRANIFLRSHVHYHNYCGGPGWLAMTLPALQAAHTKYGSKRCHATVDWGLVYFDVDKDGAYTWTSLIKRLEAEKAKSIRL